MKRNIGVRMGIARAVFNAKRAHRRGSELLIRPLFGSHGTDFRFDPAGIYTFGNIHVGDNVNLGLQPIILAALSEIRIGSNVMFGPRVTLVGGGHNVDAVGSPMALVHDKTGREDLGVVIQDDVWVGANATILRGVTIGRGSVVAGASVVTKSTPPYSIVGGNPAQVIRFRLSIDDVLTHEEAIYPPDVRLT